MNRVFILLLIALLGVATVYADERCGENAWWKHDSSTRTLTIYGTGATYDNSSSRSAFADLNIAKVVVEKGITTIGEQLFCECGFSAIELPESVTEIGAGAFASCRNLVSVKIPGNVMFPGERIFKDCVNLREVELPRTFYTIPKEAFMNCCSLEQITLPEHVMFIHQSAFLYCTSLKSIQLSEALRDIGDMAFYGCTELHDLAIPQSVNNMMTNVFGDCDLRNLAVRAELLPNISSLSKLETLTIIKGSRVINEGALANCVNLRKVTILACEQIKDRAFEHCTKIDTIIVESDGSPELGNNVFPEALYDKTKVLVPPGKFDRYRNDSGWGKFKNISDAIYKRCAKPVMVEARGYYHGYKFTCATEGAKLYYSVACPDMSEDVMSSSGTLDLGRYYEVSVYAMAEGYLPSETVKARVNMGRGAINLWQLVDSDVNSDGMVNSADVVSVYNYIISGK